MYDASTAGQGVHLADVDAEDSVLNRQGIPPLVSSASDNDDSDTDQEQEGSKGKSGKRGLGSFMSRRTAAAKSTADSVRWHYRRRSRSSSRLMASTPQSMRSVR